jgi:hypothetical protein
MNITFLHKHCWKHILEIQESALIFFWIHFAMDIAVLYKVPFEARYTASLMHPNFFFLFSFCDEY